MLVSILNLFDSGKLNENHLAEVLDIYIQDRVKGCAMVVWLMRVSR